MGSRLHAIREACQNAFDARTEENINDILDFVKDVKFFTRLTALQQRSLCRAMTLEEFGPRESVFQRGEIGDKFYIILSGSVGVLVPSATAQCPNDIHAEKCDCPNRPLETVNFLHKGMGFGELALQSDQPRSATIQTSERTEILVTKRADYDMYAGPQHRQFIDQRVKFLRQCPRIEDALQAGTVSIQDVAAMANWLNEVQLSGNAVACRQGDVVDHMIFVRSGKLANLRVVDLDEIEEARKAQAMQGAKAPTKGRLGIKGRPTIGGAINVDKPNSHLESMLKKPTKEEDDQPQWRLTKNLAKAMMEMKKKDRHERMASLETIDDDHPAPAQSSDEPNRKKVQVARSEESMQKAKSVWKKLQKSFQTVSHLDGILGLGAEKDEATDLEKGVEAGLKSVEHFADVQAARRKYTQHLFKQRSETEKKTKQQGVSRSASKGVRGRISNTSTGGKVDFGATNKRLRILRIGTLGPFEYFGDQQVAGSEKYPVSLVSDPVAELYVMSKNDILRRVPKKLFAALFCSEKETLPSDSQLLDMHRQTERWNAFRKSMHGESLCNLSARNYLANTSRDPAAGSRIDAMANLDFLGINPNGTLGSSLLQIPKNKASTLKPKDEELYSQASARFLRRFDIMKKDPGLRDALSSAGLMRNNRLHDGLPGSALDNDDQDPMDFRLDQHWYKLRKDPIGIDLDDVLSGEATADQLINAAQASSSVIATRQGVKPGRRISTISSVSADSHNKRSSVSGTSALGLASSSGLPYGASEGSSSADMGSRSPTRASQGTAPTLPALATKRRQSNAQQSEAVGPSSSMDGLPNTPRRHVGFSES